MINGIGDIICATPAMACLKERYPEARLAVIVRPHLRKLIEGHAVVDRVIDYEIGPHWRRLLFLWRMRREHFDLWVDLHTPTFNTVSSNRRDFLRNAFIMMAAGARYRLAYALPAMRPWLTHPVPIPSKAQLRSDNIADTTSDLVDPNARGRHRKFVAISETDRRWANFRLPIIGVPRIALFFGSRQSADLWPDEHILRFLELLANRLPEAEWVLVGGPFEAEMVRRLQHRWSELSRTRLHNFINEAGFGQTAALLERCQAYLGTDSGPTHIADAVGIPIVALFPQKNYLDIWRPMSPSASVIVSQKLECSPCFLADCPLQNKCMALIEPGPVLDELLRKLRTNGNVTSPHANSGA
ncbi:MAG: hypothetical protein IOMNBAOH_01739 [Rhodocyclaceae bacterium]|nr:hypothetical protein [Rhodocyclaceae bacterium]